MTSIWSGRVVTEDALTNAITKLRKAFGDSACAPQVIETNMPAILQVRRTSVSTNEVREEQSVLGWERGQLPSDPGRPGETSMAVELHWFVAVARPLGTPLPGLPFPWPQPGSFVPLSPPLPPFIVTALALEF